MTFIIFSFWNFESELNDILSKYFWKELKEYFFWLQKLFWSNSWNYDILYTCWKSICRGNWSDYLAMINYAKRQLLLCNNIDFGKSVNCIQRIRNRGYIYQGAVWLIIKDWTSPGWKWQSLYKSCCILVNVRSSTIDPSVKA